MNDMYRLGYCVWWGELGEHGGNVMVMDGLFFSLRLPVKEVHMCSRLRASAVCIALTQLLTLGGLCGCVGVVVWIRSAVLL